MSKKAPNGHGSYYYSKTSKVYVFKLVYKDVFGKFKTKRITGKTSAERDAKANAWWEEHRKGAIIVAAQQTIEQCMTSFLEEIKETRAATTYQNYEYVARKYIIPTLGHIRLTDLTRQQVEAMLFKIPHETANAACWTAKRVLTRMLNIMCSDQIITYNAAHYAKVPKPKCGKKRTPLSLTEEQIFKLLDVAARGDFIRINYKKPYTPTDDDVYVRAGYYVALNLAIFLGLRREEIFGLQWKYVYVDRKKVAIITALCHTTEQGSFLKDTKNTSSQRLLTMPNRLVSLLINWKEVQKEYFDRHPEYTNLNGMVITNAVGKFCNYSNFYKRFWKPLREAVAIPPNTRLHDMRDTNATISLYRGANLKAVSARLGHSETSTTVNKYLALLPGLEEQAATIWDVIDIGNNNKGGATPEIERSAANTIGVILGQSSSNKNEKT